MKDKILMVIIQILVLSFFLVPASYALYRSVGNNGSLAIADWNVTLEQTGVEDYISVRAGDPTSTATYTVNVKSLSEVDIVYTITITDLPSGTSVELDNSGTFVPESSGTVTFANAGTILYSDVSRTKSHTLTFKAASGATQVSHQEVNVNVTARQTLAN